MATTKTPEALAPAIRSLLLAAYDAGKRNLPWREETDPYRIWVSEIMLQQTRVEAVIPFYARWLERFPDVDALAEAEEDEVLRAWQGLGYYARARRLHQGARVVRERYGGRLPGNSEELRKLPGLGEYTAGAVASIAFGEVVPAVDGNVRRVLSRVFDLPDPVPGELRAMAGALVDPDRPGDFNQALMELGATICVPRSPRCGRCPLGNMCLALVRGTVAERPLRKPKKAVPEVEVAVLVAMRRDEGGGGGVHLLLRKRPDTGLLAGMYEFPGEDVSDGDPPEPNPTDGNTGKGPVQDPWVGAVTRLAVEVGLGDVPDSEPSGLEPVTHEFSHLKVRYRPYVLFFSQDPLPPSERGSAREPGTPQWIHEEELREIPLPVAQQKMATAAIRYSRHE